MSNVTALEVVEHFHRALRGEIPVIAHGPKRYKGNLTFSLGEWQADFSFYEGSLDHCDSITTGDERKAESEEWEINAADDGNPVYLLSDDLICELEEILNRAAV